ncbi:response regulator [Paenibacillus spiritus]|uniref:Protein-glutamate methylesterase/protein-glutamine glutaminase n=1 Tax=Paenibacillus spiritus TaxID=2496557 RepID=A0A5J5GEK4_9BACL|nr:chemotaxis response regulator protein-glutamate methylesterase [Paenibacillus spiritus]KAA9006410.1 response regulator [Paenibacillus spiritus]
MKPYNVLVVDDSAFMRKIISDLIESDPRFKVAATATNGQEALDKVKEIKPDLVTMDVEMPELNGLEALKQIMETHPLPVIMLSGINEQGMRETILALEGGAFDFIRKPSISNSQDIMAVGESLREQMNAAMQARERREARSAEAAAQASAAPPASSVPGVPPSPPEPAGGRPTEPFRPAASALPRTAPPARELPRPGREKPAAPGPAGPAAGEAPRKGGVRPPAKEAPAKPLLRREASRPAALERPADAAARAVRPGMASVPPSKPAAAPEPGTKGLRKLVAVGTSTGGPRALKTLLENIPGDFPAPIVIVQHMPPSFTKSLAQRLNSFSPLEVMEAEHGMVLKNGTAYVAPGGYHMKVVEMGGGQYAIQLTREEARNGHRPSVDTLFESLLPLEQLERHAVIMTGMGSDGAKMMKALYDAGVTSTFAENEETCVVYGMPRSAVELQCVTHVLPLQEIAPKLVQVVR